MPVGRAIWSGSVSFGLVNIPVKLYTAVREEPVRFHMLHDQDKVRLQRRMVCPADQKEVHPEHIVKGYEIAPDQYVVVDQREMDAVLPEKSRNIEITDFVDLASIDPLYYDRSYYLLPDKNAGKAYHLLLQAMQTAGKVGIARLVMRNREYLAAIRPLEGVLALSTMHFGDEVVPASELDQKPAAVEVAQRELQAARQLIDSLAGPFDPRQYHDQYKRRLQELVERKARGEQIVTPPPVSGHKGRPVDLVEALEASLARIKGEDPRPRRATKGAPDARSSSRGSRGKSTRR